MAFTGQLGTFDAQLGSIEFGVYGAAPGNGARVLLAAITVDAAGLQSFPGVADVTLEAIAVDAAGESVSFTGAADVALSPVTVDATGETGFLTGIADVALQPAVVAALGANVFIGIGAVILRSLVFAGIAHSPNAPDDSMTIALFLNGSTTLSPAPAALPLLVLPYDGLALLEVA